MANSADNKLETIIWNVNSCLLWKIEKKIHMLSAENFT